MNSPPMINNNIEVTPSFKFTLPIRNSRKRSDDQERSSYTCVLERKREKGEALVYFQILYLTIISNKNTIDWTVFPSPISSARIQF